MMIGTHATADNKTWCWGILPRLSITDPLGAASQRSGWKGTILIRMNSTFSAEQERWLKKRIANGEFHYVDDAIRQLIADRMIVDDAGMAWAKPLVNEARAAIARGDLSSLEEAERDIDRTLATLRP